MAEESSEVEPSAGGWPAGTAISMQATGLTVRRRLHKMLVDAVRVLSGVVHLECSVRAAFACVCSVHTPRQYDDTRVTE